ncbi:Uncharacterised protein [Mycobacteroides abscessus subsp. abscessus]|nr:Uncharacterised protein [Mycobacteroides abscessus subsp. abscessus]
MVRGPISISPGHGTSESGCARSRLIAVAAVTILNVEPGGYRPVVAIGPLASADWFCATPRMRPVDGWTTTIAI